MTLKEIIETSGNYLIVTDTDFSVNFLKYNLLIPGPGLDID